MMLTLCDDRFGDKWHITIVTCACNPEFCLRGEESSISYFVLEFDGVNSEVIVDEGACEEVVHLNFPAFKAD